MVKPSILLLILLASILVTILLINKLSFNSYSDNVTDVIFQIASIVALEGLNCRNLSFYKQIVLGTWMISCFFLVYVVFGEMVSITAVPTMGDELINSVEDLKSRDSSWITSPYYTLDLSLVRQLPIQQKRRKLMGIAEGLQYVSSIGPHFGATFLRR